MLAAEFDRGDMILEDRIDGLVEQFKDYSDYKKARRIVDTGSQPDEPPTAPPPGP
jgi:hypothetical protein